jgi:hypothetical protein
MFERNSVDTKHIYTADKKQSMTPLYAVGLFMILVLMTSAGVPIVAATKPAVILNKVKEH